MMCATSNSGAGRVRTDQGPLSLSDWSGLLKKNYGLAVASKTRHFESHIDLREAGELTVANVWMSSQTLTRPRQPGSADDQMLIKHIVDGSVVFEQDGQQERLEAGVLIVVDPARPFTEYVEERVSMVVLGCPKASLRRRGYPATLSRWVAADSRSPDVRLFLDLSAS